MTLPEKPKRLFLAVDPGPDNIQLIRETIEELRTSAPKARWVRPEKLHVTLVFLGDVVESKLPLILQVVEKAATEHAAFELTFAGGSTFGENKHARVLWVGIGGNLAALDALQKTLSQSLEPMGYKREHRAYSPHLTLARSGDPRGDEKLWRCAEELKGRAFGATSIREIILYESESTRDGARYVPLDRTRLRR